MGIRQFVVDAFASALFKGNPAAVCPLAHWPEDALLQSIAFENNLSETAFVVPLGDGYHLRWFTPNAEVNLCGHATLATAHVLFEHLGYSKPEIRFQTRSGELIVKRDGDQLEMNFPASTSVPCAIPDALVDGLGLPPVEVLAAEDYLVVYRSEAEIHALKPDFPRLSELDRRGVIVTAAGGAGDFVSRFFCPKFAIDEDPVTGSAHCQLTPYWAAKLGKQRLQAVQISARRGELVCTLQGNRVLLSGRARTFLQGELMIDA